VAFSRSEGEGQEVQINAGHRLFEAAGDPNHYQYHTCRKPRSPQQLGTLIAAVLAHPDTPEKVYDGIVDGLNELQTREVSRRAEFIQALIDGHNLEEKKGTVKAEGCTQ
jgi:hypothetical protein